MIPPNNPPNYNPDTPLPNNNIAESQKFFLDNFQEIFRIFGRNHNALNASTALGNHEVIELTEQDFPQTTQSPEIAVYSKKVADQTEQLFMRYPSNGKEFQISQFQIYDILSTPNQASFFSFLPGGIIVYFGFVVPNSNPFILQINPAICVNIMGVNFGVIGVPITIDKAYPSNPLPIIVNGKTTGIQMLNSVGGTTPPPQFYLIFGNI